MFGDSKTGSPYVEADIARNALVVKGTQEQIDEVKGTLKSMGELMSGTERVRIINLDNGSATTLAEALGRMLPQMRQNPVKVNIPGNEPSKPTSAKPAPEKKEPPKKEGQGSEEQDQGTEAAPQQQKPASDEKPGQKGAPINITVLGNKLIVTSDDPE